MSGQIKLSPQMKSSAMQIAAVIAQGVATRGQIPSDKVCRNVCLTALRLSEHMNQVTSLVEEHEELITLPLTEAHTLLNKLSLEAIEEEAKAKILATERAEATATIDRLRELAAAK